ncbi:uncharacterized protein LY79DRAFT_550267 [Colletotrichum navitas]|uniref:Secreted protein n=1 Tax=Colletotrichum navitas TaxID=681940 RepID=A0AAD8Q304_9PEZI|nr:uncharacterized protein LY79DRAFT_550267 [Colletotrichum navitas]KAK1594251.1 hypothetical protein LY79DRAFT_550267 [Colletotrichum navitas]
MESLRPYVVLVLGCISGLLPPIPAQVDHTQALLRCSVAIGGPRRPEIDSKPCRKVSCPAKSSKHRAHWMDRSAQPQSLSHSRSQV